MESIRLHRLAYGILLLLSVSALSPLFVHHTGAVNADAPSSLQKELDRRCLQLYNEICKGGRQDFCQQKLTPVARKGLGISNQNENIYRCYDLTAVSGDHVDKSELGVYCVDNCGNPIRCKGTVKRTVGSFHASRHDEISRWIQEAKQTYCSELQRNLDNTCNSKATGSVGRILGPSLESSVACVSTENLEFEGDGYCYNACGYSSTCPGTPASGQPYAELSQTDKTQLTNGFRGPCKPYERCSQEPGEPPKCTDESGYQVDMQDDLQRWLDRKCKAAIEQMCKTQHSSLEICKEDAEIVMRKGYGNSNQRELAYRCYYAPSIEQPRLVNVGTYGVWCVDNCGAEVLCGGTINVKSTLHSTMPSVTSWIKEGKPLFCSAYQSALQTLCDKALPGSLARYGVPPELGSATVNDSWSCVKSPLVAYGQQANCLDGCGRKTNCPGGRLESGSSDESVQRQLSPDQVDAALRDVVPPCRPTETCVASSRNPPQCKAGEYEAGASGGNAAGTMRLEDGDTLETTFSTLVAGVRIGDCYQAKLDLASKQVTVGNGDRSTVIATSPATPPSRLSVYRSGDEVSLTLQYNMGTKSSNSLFYVQRDASCVGKDPVVFDGLGPEARVTRSSTKSVTS